MKTAHSTAQNKSLIVVIGPTASGKSEYAVRLAKLYNGEIISADSRQVYKGLDIGTGKVIGKWLPFPSHPDLSTVALAKVGGDSRSITRQQATNKSTNWRTKEAETAQARLAKQKTKKSFIYIYKGIPHYCIDFVSPKKQYTVANFKQDGEKAILNILSRGKTPIICGGTGQYVDALILNSHIPEVPPNPKYRKSLEAKTSKQLFGLLKKKDPERSKTIDPHNPRRLIRALEIIHETGKPVPHIDKPTLPTFYQHPKLDTQIPIQVHYLHPTRTTLYERIEKRLKQRIKAGMTLEITNLRKAGLSWKRLDSLGLEYRYVATYVRANKKEKAKQTLSPKRFIESVYYAQLLSEIKQYAKRQETWFKKYDQVSESAALKSQNSPPLNQT